MTALPHPTPSARAPLHPNHLPDLRYVLKTLEMAEHEVKRAALRERVSASIVGMRYIIKRTEEAAASVSPSARAEEAQSRDAAGETEYLSWVPRARWTPEELATARQRAAEYAEWFLGAAVSSPVEAQSLTAVERDELIAVADYLEHDGSMSEDSALRRAALLRRLAGVPAVQGLRAEQQFNQALNEGDGSYKP